MKNLAVSGDIEDLALELGASVIHEDGRVFNAARRSGVTRLPKQATPAPQESAQSAVSSELVAAIASLAQNTKPQPQQPPVINVPPAQVVVNAPPRTGWEFTFTRNQDGTIKSIRAFPVKE